MLNRLRSLPREVWLVGLISLVNDGASDLIYPLLPRPQRPQSALERDRPGAPAHRSACL